MYEVHFHIEPYNTLFKVLTGLYVLGLLWSHATYDPTHVWVIVAVFSIIMNATYPWAAFKAGQFLTLEVGVALALCLMSVAGIFIAPPFVILAVFLHGAWDIAKHRGAGVAFFSWYTMGCLIVDWTYAGVLCVYYYLGFL